GGSLTALRYPERELVSVPAARVYYEPARPLPPAAEAHAPIRPAHAAPDRVASVDTPPSIGADAGLGSVQTAASAGLAKGLTVQQQLDDLLDIEDVVGRRTIGTRLMGNVTIGEEHATAALEVLSRFAADPRWLIYLPPTMSPSETSHRPELLEHPDE